MTEKEENPGVDIIYKYIYIYRVKWICKDREKQKNRIQAKVCWQKV